MGAPAVATKGMVTAPHAAAARAGAEVQADGGSAADAAVAMGAALAVLYPHMTGIGGDAFWLYHHARSGTTLAYNGSGAAAALADVDYYTQRSHSAIPAKGGMAVLTVPGAVDAWFAIHERFGRLEMKRLLRPAIGFARDGALVARSLARSLEIDLEFLRRDDGARPIYVDAPALKRSTPKLVQSQLASTLEHVAAHGRAWFYEGEAAERVDRWAKEHGSPLRVGDFAAHRGIAGAPLAGRFAGLESLVTPPNSQGITLLLLQHYLEAYFQHAWPADGSFELMDAAVRAAQLAYARRDAFVGDPLRGPAPLERLLSDEEARDQAEAMRATPQRATAPQEAGDTTYLAAVDADGNAVSYIQSLFEHFGACAVVGDLGMAMQNRGVSFTLDRAGIRSLEPGKRPFHTLMPAMLCEKGTPKVVYGSMGGHAQPQYGLALSLRIARFGLDPQAAIEAPRWRWTGDGSAKAGIVALESRFPARLATQLQARGHVVDVMGPWEETMGHAGAIVVDKRSGVLIGGADPRGDGVALGVDK